MNIKKKLYSLGMFSIFGMISLLFTTSQFADTTAQMSEAKQITKELEVRLLNLRRNEKDFLLRTHRSSSVRLATEATGPKLRRWESQQVEEFVRIRK